MIKNKVENTSIKDILSLDKSSIPSIKFIQSVTLIFYLLYERKSLSKNFEVNSIEGFLKSTGIENHEKLGLHYKSLILLLQKYNQKDIKTLFHQINSLVGSLNNIDDNFLPSLYEKLKNSLTKKAFNEVLKPNSLKKLSGKNLWFATQFFTDNYLSSYLSRASIEKEVKKSKKTLKEIEIVDPACGGGNFLTSSLDTVLSLYSKFKIEVDIHFLLRHQIMGFDIDPSMVELSRMNIHLFLIQRGFNVDLNEIRIDKYSDERLGFFSPNLPPALTKKFSKRIYLTNPPFAGKRDIDTKLLKILQEKYPSANGDLSISFKSALLKLSDENDLVGLVCQRSWMFLSSYKKYREEFVKNNSLVECIDLGSNSFVNISGQKTNVALIQIKKKILRRPSRFINLINLGINEKKDLLKTKNLKEFETKVSLSSFITNKNENSFLYQLPQEILLMLHNYKRYSDFALTMQGTSTGDHKKFIDYTWNRKDLSEWKLVSKGGSFSRWEGLSYHRIKWGEEAEFIKSNQGSALRNLSKIDKAQLVYSDTGTLGLNVRKKMKGQIFVASGPGIYVKKGLVFAHLAFLNSLFCSYLIRNINNKLTVSAGYIGSLPVNSEIPKDKILSSLAKTITLYKKSLLSSRVIENYYQFQTTSLKSINKILDQQFKKELALCIKMHLIQKKIDKRVFRLMKLKKNTIDIIENWVIKEKTYLDKDGDKDLDLLLVSLLDKTAFFNPRLIRNQKLGTDNLYTYLSSSYPKKLYLLNNLVGKELSLREKLPETYKLYLERLLHSIVLNHLGFENIEKWQNSTISITNLIDELTSKYTDAERLVEECFKLRLEDWITKRLPNLHKKIFFNQPILNFEDNLLKLKKGNEN